jgi:hypothetical protein
MLILRLASDSSSQTLWCLRVDVTQTLKIFIEARSFSKAAESVDEGLAERLYAKDGIGVSSQDVDGHMAIYYSEMFDNARRSPAFFCNDQRQDKA